jgi:hypothetical protein
MDVEQGNAFHHIAAELHGRPILKVLELEGHIFDANRLAVCTQ